MWRCENDRKALFLTLTQSCGYKTRETYETSPNVSVSKISPTNKHGNWRGELQDFSYYGIKNLATRQDSISYSVMWTSINLANNYLSPTRYFPALQRNNLFSLIIFWINLEISFSITIKIIRIIKEENRCFDILKPLWTIC